MAKFTKEEAIRLHLEMWSDMKEKLGDSPEGTDRWEFKHKWLKEHGYTDEFGEVRIKNNCFLCEYAEEKRIEELNKGVPTRMCANCPINWSKLTPDRYSYFYGYCTYTNYKDYEVWEVAPISKILELPERSKIN